jgi:putative acetyltransferase
MVELKQVQTAEQVEQARELFSEYQTSIDVDLCFQGFAEELAGLPGSYAPPGGRLLLAVVDGTPRGCVGLHEITSETCEMKRLYVQPGQRGIGLGRLLVARVLDEARSIGYRRIVLDTLPSMTRAQAMYGALGFEEIPPYGPNPVQGTRYLGRSLT